MQCKYESKCTIEQFVGDIISNHLALSFYSSVTLYPWNVGTKCFRRLCNCFGSEDTWYVLRLRPLHMPCRIILGLVRLQRSPSFFLQRNFLSLTSITIPLTMSNLVVSSCCPTTKQRPRRHRYWQECIPVECGPSTAVAVSGGVGGRGVCPGDVCVWGGVSQHMQWGRHPPWQNSWHTLVKTLPFRNYCCGR